MVRKQAQSQQLNLLALRPQRRLEWEHRDPHLITLVIPKFKSALMRRWFVPMLAKPNIHVRLDRFGSFFWERCDGVTTVETIVEEMAREFGEDPESMYGRIGRFVQTLEKNGWIAFPGDPPGGGASFRPVI